MALAHKNMAVESKQQNDILDVDSKSLQLIAERGSTVSQLAIMTHDLTGLDDEQKEFFKLKRGEIISSLRSQGTLG